MARRIRFDRSRRRRLAWVIAAVVVLGCAGWWYASSSRAPSARVATASHQRGNAIVTTPQPAAADEQPRRPQHAIALQYGTHRTVEPEFELFTQAECSEGHPIEEIIYDFGDGSSESSIDGKARHQYAYQADANLQELAFDTEVHVRCSEGSEAVGRERVTLSNEIGIFAAHGIRMLTHDGAALLADDDGWHGLVNIHNPHDDTLSISEWRVSFGQVDSGARRGRVRETARRPRKAPPAVTLSPHTTTDVALVLASSEVPEDAVDAQFVGTGVAGDGASVRVVVRARLFRTEVAGP